MKQEMIEIGVIGGSGVYEMEGFSGAKEVKPKTPFGDPSDAIVCGTLDGVRVGFLPRHARGHRFLPHEVNSRANIYALKLLGATKVVGVSACGSLKEEVRPRDFLIPDQLYDRTKCRANSFFGEGVVGHVGVAEPYCPPLSKLLYDQAQQLGIRSHLGGTYVCIEGPTFSTKAESKVYRGLGFSVVGMTNLPESKLAREAELCYSCIGLVTDYDVWKEGQEVTVKEVMGNMSINVKNVKKLLKAVIPLMTAGKSEDRSCGCGEALKFAVMTDPKKMNPKTRKALDLLIGKYFKKG